MIDFLNTRSIVIPEGEVTVIERGTEILWKKKKYKKELSFLGSTGTQWINVGYIPNTKTSIEAVVSGITKDSFSIASGTWFFGARAGYLNRAFGSYYNPGNNNLYYAFGTQMQSGIVKTLYNDNKKFYADGTGMYIDDVKVVTMNLNTFTTPVPLSLFGLNNNGSTISLTSFKLHYFKIWEDHVLVRDYIPVLDWNNQPCLYDKVTDELFYNQGTGEFIAS